jgi:hypothetical protein
MAIAIVTQVNSSAGHIFVRMWDQQSGLHEQHDVLIDTPADNDLVVYTDSLGVWENKTPAEAGLSEVGHDHDDLYYGKTETDSLIETAITNAVNTYVINAQSGTSYSIVSSDKNKLITMSNASASTLTINTSTAFSVGEKVDVVQLGTGQVTFAGSGVTLNYTPGLKFRAQNSVASVICIATNTYLLVGDLTV